MNNRFLRSGLPLLLALGIILVGISAPGMLIKRRIQHLTRGTLSVDVTDAPVYTGSAAEDYAVPDRLSMLYEAINAEIYGETGSVELVERSCDKDDWSADDAVLLASNIMTGLFEQMFLTEYDFSVRELCAVAEARLLCDTRDLSAAFWWVSFGEGCVAVLDAKTGLLLYAAFSTELPIQTVEDYGLPDKLYDIAVEIYRDAFAFPDKPSRVTTSNLFFGRQSSAEDGRCMLSTSVELSPGQDPWYQSELYNKYAVYDHTASYIFDFVIRVYM